jgi:hypothetical protein
LYGLRTTIISYRTAYVPDTPLLLAVSSHQNEVVKKLLAKHPEQASTANAAGELPLARCMSGVTHGTATADLEILNVILANVSGNPLTVSTCTESTILCIGFGNIEILQLCN